MHERDAEKLFEMLVQSATASATTTKVLADELTRLRAWEAILHIFLSRYYVGMPDAVSAARADRDFFVGLYATEENQAEVLAEIERIYDTVAKCIQCAEGMRSPDAGAPAERVM